LLGQSKWTLLLDPLRRLFALDNLPGLIFKGGTSLSKVYDVI